MTTRTEAMHANWQMVAEDDLSDPTSKKTKTTVQKVLYIGIVMDTTGSMGAYIESTKQAIREIVDKLRQGDQQVFVAMVAYRDHHTNEKYLTNTNPEGFTDNVVHIYDFLNHTTASGGGDGPEAVEAGLQACLELGWPVTKEGVDFQRVCVLIADAPCHGLGEQDDSFPNGAPTNVDPLEVVKKMQQQNITLHTVGCMPSLGYYLSGVDFLIKLAKLGTGNAIALGNAADLPAIIQGSASETAQLNRICDDVKSQMQQLRIQDPSLSETDVCDQVYRSLSDTRYDKLTAPRLTSGYSLELESTNSIGEMRKVLKGKTKKTLHLDLTEEDVPVYRSLGGLNGEDEPVYRSLADHGEDEPVYRSLGGLNEEEEPAYRSLRAVTEIATASEPGTLTVSPVVVSVDSVTLDRALFDRLMS